MKPRAIALVVAVGLAIGHHAESHEPPPGHENPPPPIEMPDEPEDLFVPTAPVGYLEATSGVTSTGEFSYEVPIEVPAGRAGMAPNLSLRYSSRAGNGIVGVGWALTGLSQITLCPKTIATEGVVDGVDYDGTDRFCLDGEKLIAVSGNYGGHFSEYRTERDRFAKIRSYGSNGPTSFEVFARDGRIYEYVGVTAHRMKQDDASFDLKPDGDQLPMWTLREVRDRAGNSMRYTWVETLSDVEPYGLEVYPTEITYTWSALEPQPALRRVELLYDDRPDPYFEYQGGVRFDTKRRLIRVRTFAPKSQLDPTETPALTYYLRYEDLPVCIDGDCPPEPPPSHRSRLNGIAKCEGVPNDPVCAWERQFVWTKQTPTFDVHAAPAGTFDADAESAVVLDLDGDGKDDLIYQVDSPSSTPVTYARFGASDGLGPAVLVQLSDPGLEIDTLVLPASRPLDVDSDGTSELYATFRENYYESGSAIPKKHLRYAVLHWSGTTFDTSGPIVDGPYFPGDGANDPLVDTVRVLDLDGDARPDVLRRTGPEPTDHPLYPVEWDWVYQENNGGQLSGDIGTGVLANCFANTRVADLDGDGRGQILGFYFDPGDTYCTASRGLGLDDNYIWSQSNVWKLPDLPPLMLNNQVPGIVLVDLNGDGLKDVLHPAGVSPNARITWNTGNGFAPATALYTGPHDETFEYMVEGGPVTDLYYKDAGNRAVDVNGDGLEDVISFRGELDSVLLTVPRIELHLAGYTPNGEWGLTKHTLPHMGGVRHATAGYPQVGAGWTTSQIGDFNGDGLIDIVQLTPQPGDHHFEVLLQEPATGDVITEVWDELGLHERELVVYSTEWLAGPVVPPACTYPQVCLNRGMPVVRAHYVSQGEAVGAWRRTDYDYQDPRSDLLGRGFLGFGKMRVRDSDLPRQVTTTFDHDTRIGNIYPYAGLPRTVTTIAPIVEQPANVPWQQPPSPTPTARVTTRTNEYVFVSPIQSSVWWVYPSRWTSVEWEEKVAIQPDGIVLLESPDITILRAREGMSVYDSFGNVSFESMTTAGGVRRTTTTTYTNDTSQWLIGLPETIDVSVTDALLNPPAAPRHAELDWDSTTGLLERVRLAPGEPNVWRTTTYHRTSEGLIHQISDQTANEPKRWTFFAYDAERVFVTQRYNSLLLYEVAYTDPRFGVPRLVQDPNGLQTELQYDGLGRLGKVVPKYAADGRTIRYSGDDRVTPGHPRGVVVETDAHASPDTLIYHDELDRAWEHVVTGFDGQPIHQTLTFNGVGGVIRRSRPGIGAPSSDAAVQISDTLGRPVKLREPNGDETSFEQSMFKTTLTRPGGSPPQSAGRVDHVWRDKDGRVVQSAGELNGIPKSMFFHYGPFDQLERVTAPDGLETFLYYDAAGNRSALDDPNRGYSEFVYNGFGELRSVTEPPSQTTTYTRDVLGRITHRSDVDGVTEFGWDQAANGKGRLSSTQSPQDVSTLLEYNTDGLLERTTWTFGATLDSYEFEREYDEFGRLHRLHYPETPQTEAPRFTVEQRYTTSSGYVLGAYDVSDPTWETLYEVGSRSPDLQLGERQLGADIPTTREYDPITGRLISISATTATGGYLLDYTYHPGGNVSTRVDLSATTTRTETFEYDDLDRLKQWEVDFGTSTRDETYGYDESGNISWVSVNGGIFAQNIFDGARKHLLVGGPLGTFTYDDRGRQETAPGRSVTYTAFDLPRTVNSTTTFTYDAFGKRVRKSGPAGDVVTLEGLYERRAVGSVTEHVFYVHSEEGPVAQIVRKDQESAETTLFIETDALGSVGFYTDADTGDTTRLYYSPFGKRVTETGDTAIAPNDMKLGFTGHRHDDEFGLIDMKGRVYDPAQRRFLTADPYVSDPLSHQSYNRYAYALNNPLRYIDPTGFHNQPGDVAPVAKPDGATLIDDKIRKPIPKVEPSRNGSDGAAQVPKQEPNKGETVRASMPSDLDEAPRTAPPAPEPLDREPSAPEHPDDTFLSTLGNGLVGLIPTIKTKDRDWSDIAGEVAWRSVASSPPAHLLTFGPRFARKAVTALGSADMNDAAEAAAGIVVDMVGVLSAAAGLRAAGLKPGATPGQILKGIDPKSLQAGRSSLQQSRLTAQRGLLRSGTTRSTPIQVTPEGVIWDGNHGVRAAIEAGRAIDVEVVPGPATGYGDVMALPILPF